MDIGGIVGNLKLSIEFAKRDLKERYIGTSFGQLWLIINPLITILIYTIIFSDFMKMKLNVINSNYSYSIYLIPGLLTWNYFSTLLLRLSTSIFDKSHIIKKINLPMYVFYISIVLSELIVYIISMILGIIFLIIINHPITLDFLFLIPLMFLVTLFGLGVGVILSLFNPFFRDLKEIVPIVLQLWFWMTPIIYIKDLLLKKYPLLIDINPIYYFINNFQQIFLYGKIDSFNSFIVSIFLAILSILLSGYFYKKMISAIKDII